MNGAFTLHLQDMRHHERIGNVVSFVGEDATGSFGILAGHDRFMTSLVFGLARFRIDDQDWEYLGLPGALLCFNEEHLYLSTRHYLRDPDFDRISSGLREQLLTEEETLRDMKDRLHRMEQEMFKRLWEMGKKTATRA